MSELDMWNRRYTLRKMLFEPGQRINYGEFDLAVGIGAGAMKVYGRRKRTTWIGLKKNAR